MTRRRFLLACVGLVLGGRPRAAAADKAPAFRVIVNRKNPASRLDRHFVADAFLKKRTRWGNDVPIKPVDLPKKSAVRARFSRDVLGRDVAAVRRYWAQLVFSGRGVPPPELATDEEVIAYVAEHRGAIGYVSGDATIDDVNVVTIE
jgi:ABC-type phosphate transport system substrate-binding protein